MANVSTGIAQYWARFGEKTIAGSQYALKKLGVERANCSLKIEEYIILCVPFQLGLKRSIFLASLSKQELVFFQKYVNTSVGLSISLNPNNRSTPAKFFIRSTLNTLGQMKGHENVGLFVVEYKITPDDLVTMLGNFLEDQERLKMQFEDYGKKSIRMTPEAAKLMGYNLFATIAEANAESRRIQVFTMNSKTLEHVEAAGAPLRQNGTVVSYQLFFKKYRINVQATISSAETMPQGIVRTTANLEFSPELVEIIDEYWYNYRASFSLKNEF